MEAKLFNDRRIKIGPRFWLSVDQYTGGVDGSFLVFVDKMGLLRGGGADPPELEASAVQTGAQPTFEHVSQRDHRRGWPSRIAGQCGRRGRT